MTQNSGESPRRERWKCEDSQSINAKERDREPEEHNNTSKYKEERARASREETELQTRQGRDQVSPTPLIMFKGAQMQLRLWSKTPSSRRGVEIASQKEASVSLPEAQHQDG